jgi:hypothetical protein
MTARADLVRLAGLARLVADARIRTLAGQQAACARLEGLIAGLAGAGLPDAAADQPDPASRAGAPALHARWAASRRAALNVALARERAALLRAQDAARTAFGRAEALDALAERARPPPRHG